MTDTDKSTKRTKKERSKDRQRGVSAGSMASSASAGQNTSNQSISALARGLAVLRAFRLGDEFLGNHELAERTGLPRSTVSRISFTLIEEGFLRFDQRLRMYELGPKAFALGFSATANNGIKRILRPSMESLAEETGWNVALGILDQGEMMYIESCASETLVSLRVYLGFRVPILTSGIGRAYLVAAGKEQREALMQAYPLGRGGAVVDMGREKEAIERAIQNGFADSIGDWHPDINSVAVGFQEPGTDQIYSISLGAPKYLMPEDIALKEAGPRIADYVRNALAEIEVKVPSATGYLLQD